ncbi:MAG: cupin domain-containing protein [Thiobacillus sp.]|nr:cupin domain-containing protein [Thiobacillus sp.]
MSRILVETAPDPMRLIALGVDHWPEWEKEVSEFPWEYFEDETSYIQEGRAIIVPEGGTPVEIGEGNLVTFQSGLICKWKIIEPISKRYRIG